MLSVEPHPTLDLHALVTHFPKPLGEMPSPPEVTDLLQTSAAVPFEPNDAIKEAVRALLRYGGFKPTGRSKPASEYLRKAAEEGRLAAINLAVDIGNAVALHSGLPVSVLAWERLREPLRIRIAEVGQSYVFNAAGQAIDVSGLLCLFDAEGPCANAVKDAQRTKTGPQTHQTLSLIWGTRAAADRGEQASAWYLQLVHYCGATTERIWP